VQVGDGEPNPNFGEYVLKPDRLALRVGSQTYESEFAGFASVGNFEGAPGDSVWVDLKQLNRANAP
jgi:hypothetical protein